MHKITKDAMGTLYAYGTMIGASVKPGAGSSRSGRRYEKMCYENIRHDICELGGHSGKENDIRCTYGDIEIKARSSAPDWGQQKFKYCPEKRRWIGEFLERVTDNTRVRIPKLPSNLTDSKLRDLKEPEDSPYKDQYMKVDDNAIQSYYRNKGNAYIQICGYGLYHLGEDPGGLGVPEFRVRQQMRVRIKHHTATNFSVTGAFQPMPGAMDDLAPSPYSLDDPDKVPNRLKDVSL